MTDISTIRNLGPATEAAFKRAGIHTAEQLHEVGADAAYAALLRSGERAHFISYYVLVMGLQGRSWNDCQGPEKLALRARFDALKAAHQAKGGLDGFERILNEIGVLPDRSSKK